MVSMNIVFPANWRGLQRFDDARSPVTSQATCAVRLLSGLLPNRVTSRTNQQICQDMHERKCAACSNLLSRPMKALG